MKMKIIKNKIEIEVTDEEKELILKNGLNDLFNSNRAISYPYPIYLNGQTKACPEVNLPNKQDT